MIRTCSFPPVSSKEEIGVIAKCLGPGIRVINPGSWPHYLLCNGLIFKMGEIK